ncbi:MAG: leucyl aminopeptidase [Parcubacteria group bacterium]|nr:leucyl aminopeptidase [Parcubacteria group bacterium]
MDISVQKGDLIQQECDMLVLGAFEGGKEPYGAAGEVNEELNGRLFGYWKAEKFKAKQGEIFLMRTDEKIPAKRVLVVGLGKNEDFCVDSVRQAAATSLSVAKQMRCKKVVSVLHGAGYGDLQARDCARAMVEGVRLVDYKFAKYKKDKSKAPEKFEIVSKDGRAVKAAQRGVVDGEAAAAGTVFARDLVNTPGQDMHPDTLVEAANQIAHGKGSIRVRVYNKEKLQKMGAGGILGVAQGSECPPYLVHMVYTPKKPSKKKVALVGKAVTFDSGGLSLKPAGSMETMKIDMAGSAVVLGVFSVIDQWAPKAEVHGIFGAVENMPSGKAIRPGDVLTAMNKKTIEVLNTDAEGRLTLADTLSFAVKQKPDFIIDLATLTGACVVALGEEITAVMGNNPELSQRILTAASGAGEKMWEMPLEKNYRKLIDSDIADLKNIGSRWGGCLTAGLFLQEFVDKVPWAHLDIAGPAYAERVIDPYTKKGATGHGVRTLLELLREL